MHWAEDISFIYADIAILIVNLECSKRFCTVNLFVSGIMVPIKTKCLSGYYEKISITFFMVNLVITVHKYKNVLIYVCTFNLPVICINILQDWMFIVGANSQIKRKHIMVNLVILFQNVTHGLRRLIPYWYLFFFVKFKRCVENICALDLLVIDIAVCNWFLCGCIEGIFIDSLSQTVNLYCSLFQCVS